MNASAEIASQYGGIWTLPANTAFPIDAGALQRYLGRLQASNYVVERPPIQFGLIENLGLRAFATAPPEADFIGINAGLISVTQDLFLSIMAHPEMLPHIGKSADETSPNFHGMSVPDALRANPLYSQPIRPKDGTRTSYATMLASIARLFLVNHEFCHLFNGHMDWRQKRLGAKSIDDIASVEITNPSDLDMQTLEMDADCYGVTHTLLDFLRSDLSQSLPHPNLQTYPDALFAVHFAVYCMYRLFNDTPMNADTDLLGRGNHPPAILRNFMVTATLCTHISQDNDISRLIPKDIFDLMTTRAIRCGEAAFGFLTGHPWDMESAFYKSRYPEGILEKCTQASSKLLKNWEVVKEQLQPFKRGKQLAE
jgi:hypothetical protein